MTEQARHLFAVDGSLDHETGEWTESDPQEDLLQTYERKLRAAYSDITKLKKRLANVQGLEPEADDVREVLDYWREQLMPGAKIKPGEDRWQNVKERLQDGWTVGQLKLVVDGVRMSDFHMSKRGYYDAESIYKSNKRVEDHIARAIDQQAQLAPILKLPVALFQANLDFLAERCLCGCLRIEHPTVHGDRPNTGMNPCLHCSHCEDFDDIMVRSARWIRGQTG